jgi:hypothetical protein
VFGGGQANPLPVSDRTSDDDDGTRTVNEARAWEADGVRLDSEAVCDIIA